MSKIFKVNKHVILALCFLALVLQPVTCFAGQYSSPTIYSSFNDYFSDVGYSANFNIIDDISSLNGYSSVKSQYNYNYYLAAENLSTGVIVFVGIPNDTSTARYNAKFVIGSLSTNIAMLQYNPSTDVYASVAAYKYQYDGSTVSSYTGSSLGPAWKFYVLNNVIYCGFGSNLQTSYIKFNIPNLSGGTDVSYLEDLVYYIFQDFILNNFLTWRTELNSWENIEWPSVGESLQYFMECAQNLNSSTVTIFRPQEMEIDPNSNGYVTRTNFLYSLTGNIEAILDKLDMAFPDDQATMNDAIADQILDDTNDTGLTVSRITSAKSDLDDGLSTYKLDTSGSQYSNPFSALDDADWSFWSQTTVNNLGAGYSYNFDDASLMSETDIYTENQNHLLNLLGW